MSDSPVLDSYLAADSSYLLARLSQSYQTDTIDIVASRRLLLPERGATGSDGIPSRPPCSA